MLTFSSSVNSSVCSKASPAWYEEVQRTGFSSFVIKFLNKCLTLSVDNTVVIPNLHLN